MAEKLIFVRNIMDKTMVDPLSWFLGCVIGFTCGYLGRKLYGVWHRERHWYEDEERKMASE